MSPVHGRPKPTRVWKTENAASRTDCVYTSSRRVSHCPTVLEIIREVSYKVYDKFNVSDIL